MSTALLRAMLSSDVGTVVNVHLLSFKDFFLSYLGPKFLSELYKGILADRSGIAYVCEADGKIVGFVIGSDHPGGLYQRLFRQRGLQFALASVSRALQHPRIIPRLIRAVSREKAHDVHDHCGTIMSIAVLPESQREGFGRLLLCEFLEECSRRQLEKVNLVTDRLNNEAVNRFYSDMGFTLDSTFATPEGRQMNEYMLILGDSLAQSGKVPDDN